MNAADGLAPIALQALALVVGLAILAARYQRYRRRRATRVRGCPIRPVGGYQSSARHVTVLRPPPAGPAPGARDQ